MDYKHKLRPRLINGVWSIQGTAPLVGRVRKQYASKEMAELESQKLIVQVGNHLANGEIRETLLTKSQEKDADIALGIMDELGFSRFGLTSLTDVVKQMAKKMAGTNLDMDLFQAGVTYIQDLVTRGRSENYVDQKQNSVSRLADWFGPETKVADITKDQMRAWCRGDKGDFSPFAGKDTSRTTKSAELTFCKAFFNHCVAMDYIDTNPCEGIKSFGKEKKEVVALDIDKAQEFLDIAKAHSNEALCYIALSLFAGLRPEELRPKDGEKDQVRWEHFTWRTDGYSTLAINYGTGKMSTRRVIELPDNLVKIIKPIAQESGPVIESSYAQWRGIKDYLRAKAGYKVFGHHFKHIDLELSKVSNDTNRTPYVRDVLRHTAITYRLEIVQNKDAVAMWAGNSPKVIDEHYRALVKGTKELTPRQYADNFFALLPG